MKKRGRPAKEKPTEQMSHVTIDFSQIGKLKDLHIDKRMMEQMESGIPNIDYFFSHEKGIPRASNILVCGSPGVGKTTILLDIVSGIVNRGQRCLFISGEMGRKQMFKYSQRFKQFEMVETLFVSDYLDFNLKNTIEQAFNIGWDLILVDSLAEIIDGVRDDNGWDRKTAESWFVGLCTKHNKGLNISNKYTSFLLIQQMTKSGDTYGSNKLKHLTDAVLFLRRESERDGGSTYMEFEKNRNGNTNNKMTYHLGNNTIEYGSL